MYTDVKLKTDDHANRIAGLERRVNLLCNTLGVDSGRFSDFVEVGVLRPLLATGLRQLTSVWPS